MEIPPLPWGAVPFVIRESLQKQSKTVKYDNEMSKSTQRGKKSVNQKSVTKCQQTMFTKKSIAGLKAER